jgi:predicted dehydrogenase
MKRTDRRSTRRGFLRTSGQLLATSGFALGFPTIVPRSVLGGDAGPAPSEQIRIGCIGVGNQGRGNLGKHLKETIAVCDVDSDRLAEARSRVEKATGKSCAAYGDYRRLLDQKDVDAVVITTPDHWHALMTIDACRAGKDVYCEKPLTLTIAEGRAMVNAARETGRIVETGSQQRSDANFRLACELVRSGRIGKVHTVRVGIPGVNFKGPAVPDSAPPPELDYNVWLGPAPERPYNAKRVHYNFRFFWDYSGGQLTNFGAHHLDIAQWGLGRDDSGPVSISGHAQYNKEGLFEVPESCEVVYEYDDGVRLICGQKQRGGTTFEGEKGTIHVDRKRLESDPAELVTAPLQSGDVHLEVSDDHHGNWLDCIRTRKRPICDVEIGHRSATVCHLGNIAIRTGRAIVWDPVRETIVGDADAAAMLARPYRAPWKLAVG